ncbi:MAG TPA: pseudaminic acid biosynthesis-associated methylase [Candidatus Limnocylindrales bacterium]|nr:pseudaminic acid biosynthesis-associated methylase [Candidatus Limnocylindrales bacterium]
MVDREAERLERLWAGEFGDAYVDRNLAAYEERRDFWERLLTEHTCSSALEIGCNVGGNLRWIARHVAHAAGLDVNAHAVDLLRQRLPGVRAVVGSATELPFPDGEFDLVLTMGVLIHLPDSILGRVMDEMVRCSRRYLLCGEYFAHEPVEVPYRGHRGALFKRDYGRLFAERFPELALLETGFLSRDEGFDDVTWWLFERTVPSVASTDERTAATTRSTSSSDMAG